MPDDPRDTAVRVTSRSASTRKTLWALIVGLIGLGGGVAVPSAEADDFSRIIGPTFFELPRRFEARRTRHLGLPAIEAMPEIVRGERSAFVVVTTDGGNLAKLLVSQGLRRRAATNAEPALVPVLILDRFETIDGGNRVSQKARGRNILLFERLEFDLDTGQVVPEGFGGDIAFTSAGRSGMGLAAVGKNVLYPIDQPVAVPDAEPGRPSTGLDVLPRDFGGRYTLVSNGQMGGALELDVAADGVVSGRFRSDRNGRVYTVTGKVAADLPRRIEFEIQFPRTRQVFEGLLWTEEKNVFAGTVRILEHPYSFIAVREGTALVPESIDAISAPRAPLRLRAETRVLTLGPRLETYALDGVPKSAEELGPALRQAHKSHDQGEVLIRIPPSTPFDRVQRAVRIVRGAGFSAIRLAPSEAE